MHDMMESPVSSDIDVWAERRAAAALDLQRRMMAHMAAGPSTDMTNGPMSNDAKVYFDPERFAAEKRELFGRLPLLAGLSNDVPNPGDKLLFEETGVPILIVRGRDGKVRAFEMGSKTIKVKQDDGTVREETVELKDAVHGPVFTRADGTTIALRAAGLDRPFGMQEYWDLDNAHGLTEFVAAANQPS